MVMKMSVSSFYSFVDSNFYVNYFALPFLISAIFFGIVGVYVYKQSPKSTLHFSFFSICIALFIWLFSTALLLASHDPWWIRLSINSLYFGVFLIPVTFYHYSSLWLGYYERQKKTIRLGYALGLIFIPIIWFTPWIVTGYMRHSWGHYSMLSPVGGAIFLSYFTGYALLFFANLLKGYKEAPDDLRRRQVRLVIIGFAIGFVGSDDFLPCYGIPAFPIGAFTTLILVGTLLYTIIRYRLLDIQTIIHKTFLWIVTSVIFVAPIAIIAYLTKSWVFKLNAIQYALLIFSLLVAFIPYVRIVQPWIDQRFQRRRWDMSRVFKQFTDDLVHLKSLEELAKHILQTVGKTLYPEDAFLFLWDKDQNECLVFPKEGLALKVESKENHAFFEFLGSYDSLLQPDYVGMDPRLEPIKREAAAYFQETGCRVCVPLVLDERLIGVINLGKKTNLKEYNSDELRFLSDLRGAAAIAISNSLRLIAMQASLRKWNEELEKQVEERTRELKDTQAQLIQAEKLATIGTLAGGVAHEINNPLAAIMTNAQMLLADNLTADAKEGIELIEEAARRCRDIVQKLMKYSRKSPQAEGPVETVDLNEAVDHAVSLLRYQLEQDNVKIQCALNPLPGVRGNANEMSQVLTNLVLNGRDAVLAGKKAGEIKIATRDLGKDISLEIEDNGIGIPAENLPKVFDPFFTTKDVGKGTGLGLSIVQGIIQKFGGKIDIKSRVGAGTSILIRFPKSGT